MKFKKNKFGWYPQTHQFKLSRFLIFVKCINIATLQLIVSYKLKYQNLGY